MPPLTPILTLIVALSLASGAQARPLRIALADGGLGEAQLKVMVGPFTAATGIPTLTQSWRFSANALDLLLANPATPPDVVLMPPDLLDAACRKNELAPVDWPLVGAAMDATRTPPSTPQTPPRTNPKGSAGAPPKPAGAAKPPQPLPAAAVQARFLPQAISPCGVGAVLLSDVLAWDRDKYPGTPNWADFWDVAKIPGKRGLPAAARPSLEIALLADGVAPGDVTRVLGTKDGVERAFRKLDQLKPYIVWWHEGAEAVRILASGDVLMTAAPSDLVAAATTSNGRHLGIQWTGGVASVLSWAVRKSSKDQNDAWRFIGYASDAARQAALQGLWPDGGLTKGAGDGLPPSVAATSNATPAHLAAMLIEDDNFWHANLPTLSQRFATWLQH